MTDQSTTTSLSKSQPPAESPPQTPRQGLQERSAFEYHDLLRSLLSAQRNALLLAQAGCFENDLQLRACLKILDQLPATLAAYERFTLTLLESDHFDDE